MSVYRGSLPGLEGARVDLSSLAGKTTLVVNVASKCGLTPQYEALQRLQEAYAERGFTVLGIPCNQFANQEPGDEGEIAEVCRATYHVTFPVTAKLDVNGPRRNPLHRALVETPDAAGRAGDVEWNFEKFLVSPAGEVVARFRPRVQPESDELVAAIEATLPAQGGWSRTTVGAVQPGDTVRTPAGVVMRVDRIEEEFHEIPGLRCLIEDGPVRWFAQPLKADVELQVLQA
jgi:glutathione peroxidase